VSLGLLGSAAHITEPLVHSSARPVHVHQPLLRPAESCLEAVKERVLRDMLGSITDQTAGGWRVLILDEVTTK
jgi:hypothetical protein